ncbi:MAG: flagella synthesis protein FlgN [Gammaproteobacteria bacterium]
MIEQSVRVADALLLTLQEERQVLAGADHEAFSPVFARKNELAGELSRLDQQRAALTAEQSKDNAQGSALWTRYCAVLEQCREGNAINGRLVQDRQRHVRRALGILRGQANTETELYSQRGAALPGAHSQDLGRA